MEQTIATRNVSNPEAEELQEHVKQLRKAIAKAELTTEEVDILAMFTLPKEVTPKRLGGDFGAAPSAISHPWREVNLTFPQSGGWDLPITDVAVFKFAHPLRSLLYSNGITAGSYTYNGICYMNHHTNKESALITNNLGFQTGAAGKVHGDFLYPGKLGDSDPHRGYLMTINSKMSLTSGTIPATGQNIDYFFLILIGGRWEINQRTAFTGNSVASISVAFTAPCTAYYAICATQTLGAAVSWVTYTMTIDGNGANGTSVVGAVWSQLATAGVDGSLASVQAARVNAASLMYTNTSSALYRGGQLAMRQLPPQSNWGNYISFDIVSAQEDSAVIEATIGAYAFRKPTSSVDFDVYSPTIISPGFMIPPTFVQNYISSGGDMAFTFYPRVSPICMTIRILDVNGKQGFFTSCDVLEYTTLNQLIDSETDPATAAADLDEVLSVVAAIPQFHTNDFHLSDLWDAIKGVASDVWGGIKEVASVAAPFIPMILGDPPGANGAKGKEQHPLAQVANQLASKAKQHPPTTKKHRNAPPPPKTTVKAAPKLSAKVKPLVRSSKLARTR